MPSVVVAISVRNGAPFLGEAIDSALAQDGVPGHRVVVYDNGSTDGSQDVARGRGVDVVENPDGSNFFHSMNRALAETGCDVLAPFACDDVMLPGNLARKVAALATTGAALVHGSVELMDERGRATGALEAPTVGLISPPHGFRSLVPVNRLITPSIVLRGDAVRELGGFDPRSILCGDWLCWMRLALRRGVFGIGEPLVRYRQHVDTGSVQGLRDGRFAAHDLAALGQVLDDPALPAAWRADGPRWLAAKLLHTALLLGGSGLFRAADGIGAAGIAGRALLTCPDEASIGSAFGDLCRRAGLVCVGPPYDVVASYAGSPGEAASLVAALRALDRSGILRGATVVVAPALVAAAAADLGAELERGPDLDVDLVGAAIDDVLGGPALVLADAGDPALAAADARRLPGVPHRLPSPYDRRRDRPWELLADLAEAAA